ncbi:hypothetical protein DPMN_088281 [Dreissena polymorpha]|uniref:Uncharacterized protein n=1 Tax=Dreissena polymorpha TaxID=45954 RepID=A0A9D4QW93_DREPO|nr:hypothetical protein DPMN_088281 [Dreissena polymorpha]
MKTKFSQHKAPISMWVYMALCIQLMLKMSHDRYTAKHGGLAEREAAAGEDLPTFCSPETRDSRMFRSKSLTLAKQGLMHVRKVSSQISMCNRLKTNLFLAEDQFRQKVSYLTAEFWRHLMHMH